MDDLQFYILFNSISVISGRCLDDNERLCQWNSVYGLKDFTSSAIALKERICFHRGRKVLSSGKQTGSL